MNRRAILVLGMHRSGTSVLTRIIGHLGAGLPQDPMPETADNPSGYWESRSIARFNNRLLESAGTAWNDAAPVPAAWFLDPARTADLDEGAGILADAFGDVPMLVLKDPRICRLLPFWSRLLASCGVEPCAVLVLRDPWEVACSLQARVHDAAFRPAAVAAPERGLLLWLRYVLDAEAGSRAMPRTVIDYASLIADWRRAVRELVELAPLPTITFEAATSIDGFVSAGLRRQREADSGREDLRSAVDLLRRIADEVARAAGAEPDSAAARQRLDALASSLDRLLATHAPHRGGPAATTPRDPGAAAVLAGIGGRPPAATPAPCRVLFLSGAPRSAGHVYRVEHAVEALTADGRQATWLPLDDPRVPEAIEQADLVTVFRAPWSGRLVAVRERCTTRGIPLVHDIDDLVFDPNVMRSGQVAFVDRLPEEQRQRWIADADLHRRALAEADACVVTTRPLAVAAAEAGAKVHLLPNGIGAAMLSAAAEARGREKPSTTDRRLRVGFASGTPTHHRDFATIAGALADLLAARDGVDLVVVGHLDVAAVPELAAHRARIEIRPAVSLLDLHAEVARFDVNLAPLEVGNPFCEAKSPIRVTTAALVGVPSVVAATAPLMAAVADGETGVIARTAREWTAMIGRLLDDPARRRRMGEAARAAAIDQLGPQACRARVGLVYDAIRGEHTPWQA